MQQKPYNLDRAIGLLKEEGPSADFQSRLKHRVHRRPRRYVTLVKVVPLGVASVALAIAFWPRAESNGAWAQTVERSLNARFVYRESRLPNGQLSMQDWQSGKKRAAIFYRRDGSIWQEWRSDGVKIVDYFDFWTHRFYANGSPARPVHHANWTQFAVGSPYVEGATNHEVYEAQSMDALLSQKGAVVISHVEPKEPDKFEKYRIRFEKRGRLMYEFEVEPITRLVRTISLPGRDFVQRVSYPDNIPDTVFEPRLQKVTGIPTFDTAYASQEARRRVSQGYGKIGPVTLRLVAMDAEGAVYAFWTGALPDEKLGPSIEFPGTPSGPPFG